MARASRRSSLVAELPEFGSGGGVRGRQVEVGLADGSH